MECNEDKVHTYPKISIAMIRRIEKEERYRYHYETILAGEHMTFFRQYCHKMFEVLNGNKLL
jgi:hypothetical protein